MREALRPLAVVGDAEVVAFGVEQAGVAPVVPWLTDRWAQWRREVASWVCERLGADVPAEALEPVHLRPWGAVLRADTRVGVVFFKAVGPRGRHETTLLSDLAAEAADLVPPVLAVDHGRGWFLMSHAGSDISRADPEQQIEVIESLLPHYADLQRRTAGRSDRWLAADVPDRSAKRLPVLLDELLSGRGRSGPLPLVAAEVARFHDVLDTFAQVCDQLAGGPVPSAIDHADIHGTNVLLGDGPRLIDWGDSCIGPPFSSVLVPLEWVAGRVAGEARVRAVQRLVDAYLEPWGAQADRTVLGHAVWGGYVARAVSNDEQSAGGSAADIADAHQEIVDLLCTWEAKRDCLDAPERMCMPSLPWALTSHDS